MSVIVKGMELPQSCNACYISASQCSLWNKTEGGTRHPSCPLRPLPEKHGRLADLDAIIRELRSGKSETEEGYDGVKKPGSSLVLELLIGYLDGRPTIVEAEGADV